MANNISKAEEYTMMHMSMRTQLDMQTSSEYLAVHGMIAEALRLKSFGLVYIDTVGRWLVSTPSDIVKYRLECKY
jgi:hypothetical protein